MLNAIWISLFLIAFATALIRFVAFGETEIFNSLMTSMFEMSKTGFEISIGLTGVLTLWLGILKIGERCGLVAWIARAIEPLFRRLAPEIPANHPAMGAIVMNMAANVMGLDNAATPIGIRAMKALQELNPDKEVASNAQILFLVINTSSVTLFPLAIFTYRAQLGAANPTDVFVPILISTYLSTLAGLLCVAMIQKINLLDRVVLIYLVGITLLMAAIVYYFSGLDQSEMQQQSALVSNFALFSLVIAFLIIAALKRINAYEAFIDGAKEGFQTAITIIPFLIAMLVAIGVFRSSGVLDLILECIRDGLTRLSMDTRFVDALPTALMKPLSGSGARAMMVDAMQRAGADSFSGRLACIVQGSTETTFYVLTVYFGSVGVKNMRHSIGCGLAADFAGITAAIATGYWFFG
ncbi:MAG: spore maturation protein [Methylococcaceae bacterium]|nr:spore maturation protein [Methylococcaceae bacterium]MCI0668510.1 spore maturation protein [Methylococcaceae bacterium]MCI0732832.1 spore maturation protein [Methylococcaceae bacterium]